MRAALAAALLAVLAAAPARAGAGDQDATSRAREAAFDGRRDEALRLLEARLAARPEDDDARTLMGTVLSWEGRYAEGRELLEQVLARSPTHYDAVRALINLELWSGHPARAEQLARETRELRPEDEGLRLFRARALRALRREDEALVELDRLLASQPENREARELLETIRGGRRRWRVAATGIADWFDDGREAWRESRLSVRRRTPLGSVIGRWSRAARFGLEDDQFELEAYPRLGDGLYAYVAFAVAPDPVLYPRRRFGIDVYRSLPGAFEVSVGYRRLGFDEAVDLWVGSLSRYHGQWLFTARVFAVPDSVGASGSLFLQARRYFGDDSAHYLSFRLGQGLSREEVSTSFDVAVLDSRSVTVEWNRPIGRLELGLSAGWSSEQRLRGGRLRRLSAGADLAWRF